MERNIIDGSHSKDSMEIMDKLMQEELRQEEVIRRTSKSRRCKNIIKNLFKRRRREK